MGLTARATSAAGRHSAVREVAMLRRVLRLSAVVVALVGLSGVLAACEPSPPPSSALASGKTLRSGQALQSSDGVYRLTVQGDGNVVLTRNAGGAVIWHAGT